MAYHIVRRLSLLAVVLALAACNSGNSGASCSAGACASGDGVIRLIHYNDLHAHLVPHTTLVADCGIPGHSKVAVQGGIARLATVIQRLRAENPSSLLMNIGDTYHGGVEALYTQGEAVAAPVNALGIDVGVPGNWDYAYGPGDHAAALHGARPTAGLRQCIRRGSPTAAAVPEVDAGAPTLPS